MSVLQRVTKPTTHKGKKVLLSREPKILEDSKKVLFVRGRKTSELTVKVLKDIYDLKKPDAKLLNRKNDINPFEDATPLETFSRKHEAGLFMMATHSKKRPHNIVLGRTFDHNLLDMIELGVEDFKALNDFKNDKIGTGIKPCIVFNGPTWEETTDLKRLKSLLIDTFHREKVDAIRLQGLEHVLSFTATPDAKILMRSYRILLKKSGQRTPRIELEEIGPSADFSLRRTKLASDDLMKLACRKPQSLKKVVKKNITRDAFGSTLGRIHMGKVNINKLQLKRMKGIKPTAAERSAGRLRRKAAKADKSEEPNAKKRKSTDN